MGTLLMQSLDTATDAEVTTAPRSAGRKLRSALSALLIGSALGACTTGYDTEHYVTPLYGSPVSDNNTPYTACLRSLAETEITNKPVFAIGQISDKTGQRTYGTYTESTELTQGVSEMVISSFYKTRQVTLTERLDVRVALAEQQLIEQDAITMPTRDLNIIPANFMVLGALTELNYNIVSGGVRLYVAGIGGGVRKAVINVGLDMRLVDVRTLQTLYVTSLQKQIVGYEVEAGVYRFFGDQLIEFDAGAVKNEPLQLGVRSVVELATYQILTEGLGFPAVEDKHCVPGVETHEAARAMESEDE